MSISKKYTIKDFFSSKKELGHGSGESWSSLTMSSLEETRSETVEYTATATPALEGQAEAGEVIVISKGDGSASEALGDFKTEPENDPLQNNNDPSNKKDEESADHSSHYYWKNFVDVLTEVRDSENLRDLFSSNELSLLKEFSELSLVEQKLYVRLLNRKHSWLRTSSVKYDEINPELDPIINVLVHKGLLSTDVSEEETSTLLNLMPLQEIRSLCKCFRVKSDGKKESLVKSLIDLGHQQKSINKGISEGIETLVRERAMKALGKIVKLSCTPRKLFLRILLLHALPFGREMEMDGRIPVMNEVSRVKSSQIVYPSYPLHPLKNFFGSRDSVIRFQEALEILAITNGKMLMKCYEEVLCLYYTAMNDLRKILEDSKVKEEDAKLPLYLRSFTAGHALVRAVIISIECLRIRKMYPEVVAAYQLLLSQNLYVHHHHGKWYDQLALTYHHHLKDVPAAINVLIKGLNDESVSSVDKLLLSNRGLMITNRKAKSKEEMEKNKVLKSMLNIVSEPPEITITATSMSSKIGLGSKLSYMNKSSDGIGHVLSSVEETVIHHHKQLGFDKGIHAENAVSMSIFGIFFWDIIYFIDVDNVFLCPYQSLPLDLKSGEFYQNRKKAIDKRLKEMQDIWTIDEMKVHLRNVCSQEQGKVSAVSWRIFENLDELEVLMECVGLPVISKICRRMAEYFPLARRGFPDVIIWNSVTKKCKFLEVKGPGDRLSPSQILWLNYLNDSGAEAAVCHVKTLGSKSLKRQHMMH